MPLLAIGAYWATAPVLTLMCLGLLLRLRASAPRNASARALAARVEAGGGPRLAYGVIGLAIAQCAFYLCIPNFIDYGEPVIPLLAGNILHAAPVYGDWRTGQYIVGSNYGPYVFLAQLPALLWLPSIFGSKLVGVGVGLLSLALFFTTIRRRVHAGYAAAMTALMVAMLCAQLHTWFWNRPDSFLLALTVIGIVLFEITGPAFCLAAIALLAGLATDFKAFGAIYLLPLAAACALSARSWRRLAVPTLVGGALFVSAVVLPFLLPSFSAKAYLANLSLMPKQGFFALGFCDAAAYGLIILSPLALTWPGKSASPPDRAMAITLVICAALVAVIAGKPGGGTPYMMPFAPPSLYLTTRLASPDGQPRPLRPAAVHKLVFAAVIVFAAPCWAFSWYKMAQVLPVYGVDQAQAAELRALLQAFPGSEVGHNSGPATDDYFRVEKAFLGQATRFDYVNLIDQRVAGVPASVVYPLLTRCAAPNWIVPRSGGFLQGADWNGRPLFDAGALERFHASYALSQRFRYYEVWRCRADAPGARPVRP
jgi:hypothetical protein